MGASPSRRALASPAGSAVREKSRISWYLARRSGFFAVFLVALFFAGAFLAAVFFAAVFLAAVFLAGVFFAGAVFFVSFFVFDCLAGPSLTPLAYPLVRCDRYVEPVI